MKKFSERQSRKKGMGSCREQNTGAFALESSNRVTGILEREQNNAGEGTQRNNSGQLPTIEKLNLKLKRLTNSDDKKCFDSYNLSMFLLTLLPLPDNTAEHYKQQRLDFLNNFSVQQIRLMLFVIMKLSEKEIFTEVTEFINFWTIRYLEIQEAE